MAREIWYESQRVGTSFCTTIKVIGGNGYLCIKNSGKISKMLREKCREKWWTESRGFDWRSVAILYECDDDVVRELDSIIEE